MYDIIINTQYKQNKIQNIKWKIIINKCEYWTA